MTANLEELARVIQSRSSSSSSTEWLEHVREQLEHWPSAAAFHAGVPPWLGNAPARVEKAEQPDAGDSPVEQLPPPLTLPLSPIGALPGPRFLASAPGPIDYFQISLEQAANELQGIRSDTRNRTRRAFLMAVVFATVGGIAFFAGLGLWMGGLLAAGIPSGAAGVIASFVSTLFFRFYRAESGALAAIADDLRRIEEARVGLWLASQIADTRERDKAISTLAATLARAPTRRLREGAA